ncbi:hypothetical protein [Tomitella fengzijianii]|uniref:hypothetical protein n=1 Tax=Tomitella fengzijianii TaxID=2597660 RepID=UPI001E3BB0F7|nr:hypothetical protein [Tomitella fengzijianii]
MRAQAPSTGSAAVRVRRAPAAARAALPTITLALWPLALALLIVGPLLGGGYLLLRDAVSAPRSFFTDAALGVSDSAPRAVPQDVLVAALSSVLDGGIVVKAVLVLALWAAGAGASAMVGVLLPARGLGLRAAGLAGRLTASTLAVWNPFVAERLLQGHWSLLTGYAALPWLVWAGVRMRSAPAAGIGVTLLALALAGLTPTGAVLAVIVALVVAALPGGWRRAVRVAVIVAGFAAVAAPWLITAAMAAPGSTSDPAGVDAFAARAEPHLGTLGSLAGLGGIWNSQALPPSRTGAGALIGTLILLALVACGVRGLWRRRAHPVIAAVVVLAVLAVVLPALGATAPGLAAARWAVENVPGAGLFRDAQKWVALAMPGYTLAAALGVRALSRLPRRLPGIRARVVRDHRENRRAAAQKVRGSVGAYAAAAAISSAVLIAALPSLAWGVGGALQPAHYPQGWDRVAAIVDSAPSDGAMATLPAGSFRDFAWTRGPVLDPAPRYFRTDVLVTGDLLVGDTTVGGEGTRARDTEEALLAGAAPAVLAHEGVRWVLVQHGTPGTLGDSAATLAQAEQVYSDPDVSLYRIPGPVAATGSTSADRGLAWAGHALWLAAAVTGAALTGGAALRQRMRLPQRA